MVHGQHEGRTPHDLCHPTITGLRIIARGLFLSISHFFFLFFFFLFSRALFSLNRDSTVVERNPLSEGRGASGFMENG